MQGHGLHCTRLHNNGLSKIVERDSADLFGGVVHGQVTVFLFYGYMFTYQPLSREDAGRAVMEKAVGADTPKNRSRRVKSLGQLSGPGSWTGFPAFERRLIPQSFVKIFTEGKDR